jgi:signal transduction histidine kinase
MRFRRYAASGTNLTQLFSNLIENAIRHAPMHTTIRVALQSSEDAIVAAVSDDIANLHQATLRLADAKPGLCVSANFC